MRAAAPGSLATGGRLLSESDTAGLEVYCVDPFDGNRQQATAQASGTNVIKSGMSALLANRISLTTPSSRPAASTMQP
jgi:hypothetical protein